MFTLRCQGATHLAVGRRPGRRGGVPQRGARPPERPAGAALRPVGEEDRSIWGIQVSNLEAWCRLSGESIRGIQVPNLEAWIGLVVQISLLKEYRH